MTDEQVGQLFLVGHLGAGAYVLSAIAGLGSAQNERKDALLNQLAKNCIIIQPKAGEPQP